MTNEPPALSLPHLSVSSVLGEGSMGVVYKAEDQRLKVTRAVKVLASHLVRSPQVRTRFTQEAQIMAALNHPNVVAVFDVDLEATPPIIVMEYLPGGTLRQRIDAKGPLAPRLACAVIKDVLEALQAAHDQGVLHRDIKPENVLIAERGVVKLSDFGVAHVDNASHSFTRTGAVLGTFGFMSPEQRQSAKGLTAQSDL